MSTVASDRSFEVFRLRQLRGELTAPKAGQAQTAYVPREITVMDRLHADMIRRLRERKQK